MRPSHRKANECRSISFDSQFTRYAEGSVLARFGNTHVLCTASVIEGVPRFMRDSGQGWITAEYGMLPRSTHTRCDRDAVRGKQNGRTIEIQRLIGRSLRSGINLSKLGDHTIMIDCDVLQADGGTRCAAISGGYIALVQAIQHLQYKKMIKTDPVRFMVAGISVGIVDNQPVLDLDYDEDSRAQTDMNLIMNDQGAYIEIQGTAEKEPFSPDDLQRCLALGKAGIDQITATQREVIGLAATV